MAFTAEQQAIIDRVKARKSSSFSPEQQAILDKARQRISPQQLESDVPLPPDDVDRLSKDQKKQYFGTQDPAPERPLSERVAGMAEAGAAATLGGIPAMAGQMAGTAQGVLEYLANGDFSNPPAELVTQRAQEGMDRMSIQPPSEAGREYLQGLGEIMAPAAPVAAALSPMATSGLGTMARASVPKITQAAPAVSVPRPWKSKAPSPQALIENTTDSAGWKMKGNKVVPNMLERDLHDLHVSDKTITTMRSLSKQPDKEAALRMLDAAEGFVKNKEGSDLSRPSAVAGTQIMKRFDLLKDVQKKASEKIGEAVKKDLRGKPVDVSDIRDGFVSSLEDNGVTFFDDGSIRLKDLAGFEDADKSLLSQTYRRLSEGTINADDLHSMKQAITKKLSYDKRTTTPLSADAERVLKGVRADINERLRGLSDAYADANDDFAKAASGLKPFEEALGRKFDPDSSRVENFTGTQLRKVLSNYANADELVDAVKNINDVANELSKKHEMGVTFGNEVIPLVRLNSDLESMLGSFAPQSAQGVLEKAGGVVGQRALGGMAEMAGAGMDAVKRRTSLWESPVNQKLQLIEKLREQVKSQ